MHNRAENFTQQETFKCIKTAYLKINQNLLNEYLKYCISFNLRQKKNIKKIPYSNKLKTKKEYKKNTIFKLT